MLKDTALGTWANLRGWRTKEQLVVLESDDWGSVRMPSPSILADLTDKGIITQHSNFDRYDSLESGRDISALVDLLGVHSQSLGRPVVMTFNTVMGNPDFAAIRNDNYERFHHERLFDSYIRNHGEDLRGLWHSAVDSGLIHPQFHGREHLNSDLWLQDLQNGRTQTCVAFDHGFYATRCGTSSKIQRNYLAAYWAESESQLLSMATILEDGLRQFKEEFGYNSRSMIPCNYIWPSELDETLAKRGVTLIQGQRGQATPQLDDGGRLVNRRRFTGQTNHHGQHFSVRNVLFEPYSDASRDWVGTALKDIRQAFLLRRPAVITSHRVNYTSGMSIQHRDRCLRLLDELITKIRRIWPEVIFVSSDQLGERMQPLS